MTEQLLTAFVDYGLLLLIPVMFASAVGIPLPSSLLLVAAGAFTSGGITALLPFLLAAVITSVAGNLVGYTLGKYGGTAVLDRWGPRLHISPQTITRADAIFKRYGRIAVVLACFPFSPLNSSVNILAGAAQFPLLRFLPATAFGVTIWASVYLSTGYIFAASWDQLASILGTATQALTLAVILILLAVLLMRMMQRRSIIPATLSATTEPEQSATGDLAPAAPTTDQP